MDSIIVAAIISAFAALLGVVIGGVMVVPKVKTIYAVNANPQMTHFAKLELTHPFLQI